MLINFTIEEIRKGISNKEFSYSELINAYYNQFNKLQCLNAHLGLYWIEAQKQAAQLDKINVSGALTGIPIAIKDLFLVKGTKTTAASKILEDFIAPYDAFVIQKLKEQGALMPFKTNMDEFAMGSSNLTSAFGPVVNPWILSDGILRVPGGSSGGSAAAVAASMCLGALGTDTGGSIRQPASFCGIVGFKPTYGRCSRRGVIAFASSLDHPGAFARNIQDACIILESMAGHDKLDATSLAQDMPKLSNISANVKGKKIGIDYEKFAPMSMEYKNALDKLITSLKQEGAIVEDIQLPSFEDAIKLYYIIAPAEAASNLARYDGVRYGPRGKGSTYQEIMLNTRSLFGTEVKRRILIGNFVLLSGEHDKFFGKASRLRMQMIAQMDNIFKNHDAVLLPTTSSTAFEIGVKRSTYEMYLEDLYTVIGNVYGGPAMQLPFMLENIEIKQDKSKILPSNNGLPTNSLPIGIQIMSAREDEANLVEIAKKMEEIIGWDSKFSQKLSSLVLNTSFVLNNLQESEKKNV